MYEPIIEKEIAKYKTWIDEAKAINGHAMMVRRLETEFPDWFYHASATNGMRVSFKFTDKDQLLRVLRHLRGYDYKVTSFEDSPSDQCRIYSIDKLGHAKTKYADPDIKLLAYFQSDDATCKYVEVGTKIVAAVPAREAHEVPILELRCGDEAVVEVV